MNEQTATYLVQHPAGTFLGIVLFLRGRIDPKVRAREAWGTMATITKHDGPSPKGIPRVYLDLTGE